MMKKTSFLLILSILFLLPESAAPTTALRHRVSIPPEQVDDDDTNGSGDDVVLVSSSFSSHFDMSSNRRLARPKKDEVVVPDRYETLGDAIAAGETKIFIREGNYLESTTIQITNPHTSIRGGNADTTILTYTGVGSVMIVDRTEHVSIKDITLDAKSHDTDEKPIWEAFGVFDSNYTSLKNTIVYGSNHAFAVFFAGPRLPAGQGTLDAFEEGRLDHHNSITSCTVLSTFPGDVLSFSLQAKGIVKDNTVTGGVIAFFMNRDSNCVENTVYDSLTWGIFVSVPAFNNLISNNRIVRSRNSAIKVARQIDHRDENGEILTPYTYRAERLRITKNHIFDTRFMGIEIDQTAKAFVSDNVVSFTDYSAYYVLRSDNIRLRNNIAIDYGQVPYGRDFVHQLDTGLTSGIFMDSETRSARVQTNTIVGRSENDDLTPHGIRIYNVDTSRDNQIRDNLFVGSFASGIAIEFNEVHGHQASNNLVLP